MQITAVYETILYGEDLGAMEAFYAGVLGLRRVGMGSDRGLAFRVSPTQVLLVFRASRTRLPNPQVPSHGTDGPGHAAFSIEEGAYDRWKHRLSAAGFDAEREVTWPVGGRSLYVRDPAGNSVEFVEGQVWPD